MNMKEGRLLDVLLRALLMAVSLTGVSLPAVLKGRHILKRKQTRSCKNHKIWQRQRLKLYLPPLKKKKKELDTTSKNSVRGKELAGAKKAPLNCGLKNHTREAEEPLESGSQEWLTGQNWCWNLSFDQQISHLKQTPLVANTFFSSLSHLQPSSFPCFPH